MAKVIVIFGGQTQSEHEIGEVELVVGREPECQICIDNLGISRKHCAFSAKGEAFVVRDMGSANGTYVNGRKVTEHYLNDGDEIIIGKYTLRFANTEQQSKAVERDTSVPDTLNTYVMDGSKIKEQLAKMRGGEGAPAEGGSPAAPAPDTSGKPVTAKDYAKAMEGAPAPAGGEQLGMLKNLIIAAMVLVLILLIVVVLFATGVLKTGG